jgi:hypothetical protein
MFTRSISFLQNFHSNSRSVFFSWVVDNTSDMIADFWAEICTRISRIWNRNANHSAASEAAPCSTGAECFQKSWNPPLFRPMEPKVSLPCSQQPVTSLYSKPYESNPHTYISYCFKIHVNIIFPFSSRSIFSSGLPVKMLYAMHLSSLRCVFNTNENDKNILN